jgi:molecular chaperone GrpE
MAKNQEKSAKEEKIEITGEEHTIPAEKVHAKPKGAVNDKKQDIKSEKESKQTKHAHAKDEHSKEKELKKKISELEHKSKEWQDKYIRLSAEFDNYRKRTLKEKAELILNANENLLRDILPVVDDFERGIDHIDKSEDLNALKTGIHLIYSKFSEFLKQKGIKEIEAKGQSFDLDFHEAMTKLPAAEDDKGKVLDVIEKGYTLNDKVIRYAKVIVGD